MDDWFEGGSRGTAVDVLALLDSDAGRGLLELVQEGAFVTLGVSSDGGALGVGVLVDGRRRKEWFKDVEGLGDWVAEALPAVRSAVAQAAPSGPRGRNRRR